MLDLYINYKPIDLLEGEEIAMTYQINELGEVKDRQAHFSNTFTIPYSISNVKILENLNDPQSDTEIPYRNLDVQVLATGGVNVAQDGKAQIESCGEGFNINILAGNFTLYDYLSDKSIRDLDLSEYDHNWIIDEIVSNGGNNRTDGYVYPLIDYGVFSLPSVSNIDARYLHNCFYVHTLITKIFEESPFTISGNLLENEFYKRLVLPVIETDLTATRANKENIFEVKYETNTFVDGSTVNSGSNINFTSVILDPQNGWDNIAYTYTIPDGFEGVVSAKMFILPLFSDSLDFTFSLVWRGVSVHSQTITQEGAFILTTGVQQFSSGDTISVVWEGQSNTDSIIIKKDSRLFTEPDPKLVYEGKVNVEELLHNISQYNLLKTVLQIFGGIIDTNAQNEVRITTLNEIINNIGHASDWSKKIVQKKGQSQWYISKQTKFGKYGRENHILYKDDSLVTHKLGDGFFTIDDDTLPGTKTMFTLLFAASDSVKVGLTSTVALVNRYEETGTGIYEATKKAKPRILYLADEFYNINYEDDSGITPFSGIAKAAKFIDKFQSNNLGFGNSIIEDQYLTLSNMLNNSVKITAWVKLNPADIENLDFFIPVFLEQANTNFIINKVVDYIDGELTQVELIKI